MKGLKLYIIAVCAFIALYLVAQYNRTKAVNWEKTLNSADKTPFGTYVLFNRLNDVFPNARLQTFREPVYNVIADHGIKHGTYLIVCEDINLNEYDYAKLKAYIGKGNDVFIAASYFSEEFKKNFKVESRIEFHNKVMGKTRFTNKYLDTSKYYNLDRGMADGYFNSFDTAKAVVLGSNGYRHANFIKYTIGKGNLYLNANPLMFTNYSILVGFDYAATALSFVKNDTVLLWDEYYTKGREDDESTMRVFLRNPPLRLAFYIAFFGMVLFIIYEKKRRQRIIPVIEPLGNSTIEFVSVVGQVYYEQRDNTNIAQKKATYFLEYLRTKYNLKTSALDSEFKNALSNKSGVAAELIKDIVDQVTLVRGGLPVSDNELIALNKNIEQFYLQSR